MRETMIRTIKKAITITITTINYAQKKKKKIKGVLES
jgi:hypothetical protein